jgi:hypothetical protein
MIKPSAVGVALPPCSAMQVLLNVQAPNASALVLVGMKRARIAAGMTISQRLFLPKPARLRPTRNLSHPQGQKSASVNAHQITQGVLVKRFSLGQHFVTVNHAMLDGK